MATYIFGDLHGCFDEFTKLLKKVNFDEHKDELMVVGDLIGRGPKPLKTLNLLMQLKKDHKDTVHYVLGNHDLNFLSIAAGFRAPKKRDNLEEVLNAPNFKEIVDFFCTLPLIHIDHHKKIAIAHAGVYPKWTLKEAKEHSDAISEVLSNPLDRDLLLCNMYADHPTTYDDALKNSTLNYWRFVLNAFTRMRLCTKDLILDYGHSDCSVEEAELDKIYPWFEFGRPYMYEGEIYNLCFGHWAALEARCNVAHITALDNGCVWGKRLCCYCCESRKMFYVDSQVNVEF